VLPGKKNNPDKKKATTLPARTDSNSKNTGALILRAKEIIKNKFDYRDLFALLRNNQLNKFAEEFLHRLWQEVEIIDFFQEFNQHIDFDNASYLHMLGVLKDHLSTYSYGFYLFYEQIQGLANNQIKAIFNEENFQGKYKVEKPKTKDLSQFSMLSAVEILVKEPEIKSILEIAAVKDLLFSTYVSLDAAFIEHVPRAASIYATIKDFHDKKEKLICYMDNFDQALLAGAALLESIYKKTQARMQYEDRDDAADDYITFLFLIEIYLRELSYDLIRNYRKPKRINEVIEEIEKIFKVLVFYNNELFKYNKQSFTYINILHAELQGVLQEIYATMAVIIADESISKNNAVDVSRTAIGLMNSEMALLNSKNANDKILVEKIKDFLSVKPIVSGENVETETILNTVVKKSKSAKKLLAIKKRTGQSEQAKKKTQNNVQKNKPKLRENLAKDKHAAVEMLTKTNPLEEAVQAYRAQKYIGALEILKAKETTANEEDQILIEILRVEIYVAKSKSVKIKQNKYEEFRMAHHWIMLADKSLEDAKQLGIKTPESDGDINTSIEILAGSIEKERKILETKISEKLEELEQGRKEARLRLGEENWKNPNKPLSKKAKERLLFINLLDRLTGIKYIPPQFSYESDAANFVLPILEHVPATQENQLIIYTGEVDEKPSNDTEEFKKIYFVFVSGFVRLDDDLYKYVKPDLLNIVFSGIIAKKENTFFSVGNLIAILHRAAKYEYKLENALFLEFLAITISKIEPNEENILNLVVAIMTLFNNGVVENPAHSNFDFLLNYDWDKLSAIFILSIFTYYISSLDNKYAATENQVDKLTEFLLNKLILKIDIMIEADFAALFDVFNYMNEANLRAETLDAIARHLDFAFKNFTQNFSQNLSFIRYLHALLKSDIALSVAKKLDAITVNSVFNLLSTSKITKDDILLILDMTAILHTKELLPSSLSINYFEPLITKFLADPAIEQQDILKLFSGLQAIFNSGKQVVDLPETAIIKLIEKALSYSNDDLYLMDLCYYLASFFKYPTALIVQSPILNKLKDAPPLSTTNTEGHDLILLTGYVYLLQKTILPSQTINTIKDWVKLKLKKIEKDKVETTPEFLQTLADLYQAFKRMDHEIVDKKAISQIRPYLQSLEVTGQPSTKLAPPIKNADQRNSN
jgi:hypothetical protein